MMGLCGCNKLGFGGWLWMIFDLCLVGLMVLCWFFFFGDLCMRLVLIGCLLMVLGVFVVVYVDEFGNVLVLFLWECGVSMFYDVLVDSGGIWLCNCD